MLLPLRSVLCKPDTKRFSHTLWEPSHHTISSQVEHQEGSSSNPVWSPSCCEIVSTVSLTNLRKQVSYAHVATPLTQVYNIHYLSQGHNLNPG